MNARGGNQHGNAGGVCEAYLSTREPAREIDDVVLREAAARALHKSAPPAKMVALCQLVALLERRQ